MSNAPQHVMEDETSVIGDKISVRELEPHEIDAVSGGFQIKAFGYTIGQDQIAGGGSYSYICHNGTTIYSELCWPR